MDSVFLKNKRKELKLSQAALGKLAGVSGAYIQQLENNLKKPSLETLAKIADALGVRMTDLICDKSIEDAIFSQLSKDTSNDKELINIIRDSDDIEDVIGALLLFNTSLKYNIKLLKLSDEQLKFIANILSASFESIYEAYIDMISE